MPIEFGYPKSTVPSQGDRSQAEQPATSLFGTQPFTYGPPGSLSNVWGCSDDSHRLNSLFSSGSRAEPAPPTAVPATATTTAPANTGKFRQASRVVKRAFSKIPTMSKAQRKMARIRALAEELVMEMADLSQLDESPDVEDWLMELDSVLNRFDE